MDRRTGDSTADTNDHEPSWDGIAPGYDRTNTPSQMQLAGEGLRRIGIRPGTRLLDVAAGSGALSVPAARLGASVLATDGSPVMLDLLRKRADDEALDIDTRVMDGQDLALEDDSFDAACSQFGVMLFPDMPRGIREMTRVVKPGGRVLVIAYGDPDRIDFLAFLIRAIRSVRPGFEGPPTDPPPLEFQLADPERLRTEMTAAGLGNVQVETVTEETTFRTGHELWDWVVSSNPIVEAILGSLSVTAAERDVIRDSLERQVRERAADEPGATLTNPVNIGVGIK